MLKTVKFGGSSLASAEQFRKVKAIIERDAARRYVVVSAPGKRFPGDDKITDLLYRCQALRAQNAPFDTEFQRISDRFVSIRDELGLNVCIEAELFEIRSRIEAGTTPDYAASRGEYLNAKLLSAYLGFDFLDAVEFIRFRDDGTFDDDATAMRQNALLSHERAVIPGFYGRLRSGAIHTFSRGGSDITGAIAAKLSNSDVYENWTDVSGFLMTDPRIVPDAKVIETVTYSELRELSYMGATVLHEDSIFPVRKARIPIHVLNTNDPDAKGTMIVPDSMATDKEHARPLTGIAGRRGYTVITLTKDNLHNDLGYAYRLMGILARNGISAERMPSGIDTISLVVDDKRLTGKMDQLYHDIMTECAPDTVEIASCIALIASVGIGMVRNPGVAAKLFEALARAEVNARLIDQDSNEMNIIIGVEQRDFERAVEAIYRAFA
ncbi:MAG: aspartate kinase [Clostridia bacterium]|nr:aspartate kinase [Clostridia bacterium]